MTTGAATGGAGGAITVTVGDGDTGTGGAMTLTAGKTTAASAVGGAMSLTAGEGAGAGGAVTITTGVGTATNSGAMTLATAAAGTNGNSGAMSIKTVLVVAQLGTVAALSLPLETRQQQVRLETCLSPLAPPRAATAAISACWWARATPATAAP